jgi:hypothetical protein
MSRSPNQHPLGEPERSLLRLYANCRLSIAHPRQLYQEYAFTYDQVAIIAGCSLPTMTRTQAASRVEDQIYEYVKLELPSEVAKLEAEGFSGEELDRELSRVIEERQEVCNQQRREIQEKISELKTKISDLRKRKLDTRAFHESIKRLEEQKQGVVAFEFWREYGQPPSTRTVELWLKPIEERNNKAKNSRSPGWHGDTLILRTRDGEYISVTRINQVWQIDHTKADNKGSLRIKRLLEAGVGELKTLQQLEKDALRSLREFDAGKLDLESTLQAILA